MKQNNCFDCLNHTGGVIAENCGWHHNCGLGIDNDGLIDVKKCDSYSLNTGFQIGGYYSHIHFTPCDEDVNPCMEMFIHSDGNFPTEERERMIQLHICDFRQIEYFVSEWGKYLRDKGIIDDENE